MRAHRTWNPALAGGALLAVTALVVTGCGSSASSTKPAATSSGASPVSSIAAGVPAAVKSKGTLTVEKGTTQQDDAQAQAAKCKSAGKPAVTVEIFNDQNAANLALSSGRADVSMADTGPAAYQVKLSNGVFKLSGPAYGTAPYGI